LSVDGLKNWSRLIDVEASYVFKYFAEVCLTSSLLRRTETSLFMSLLQVTFHLVLDRPFFLLSGLRGIMDRHWSCSSGWEAAYRCICVFNSNCHYSTNHLGL